MKVTNYKQKLEEKILTETTLEDAAAQAQKDLEQPTVVLKNGDIEDALDQALDDALYEQASGGHDYPNVLIEGIGGTGKTARTIAWAKRNNINLVTKLAASLDDADLGGALAPDADRRHAIKLSTTEFNSLGEEQNSVLFLDEYNRAPRSVRGTLLTLIQDHIIPDSSQKSGMRKLPNFLFTVAAINPADSNYNTDELDDAERSRFKHIDVVPSNENLREYLVKQITTQYEKYAKIATNKDMLAKRKLRALRQIELANTVLSSKAFSLDGAKEVANSKDNGNGLILTYRTFTNLLKGCDGTKEDFLAKWNYYCNSTRKPEIALILKNYKDIEDKANDVLKRETQSSVFGKHVETDFEKLSNIINNMAD